MADDILVQILIIVFWSVLAIDSAIYYDNYSGAIIVFLLIFITLQVVKKLLRSKIRQVRNQVWKEANEALSREAERQRSETDSNDDSHVAAEDEMVVSNQQSNPPRNMYRGNNPRVRLDTASRQGPFNDLDLTPSNSQSHHNRLAEQALLRSGKPEVFTSKTEIGHWWRTFVQFGENNHFTFTAYVSLLKALLDDTCGNMFHWLAKRDISNLPELESEMVRVFKRDKKSDVDIRQQFYSRKQKVNESESEFLTNLWLLVQEANPGVNVRDRMDYAVAAVFANNIGNEVLRDKLSTGLEEGRYNSTSELLDAATKHSSSRIRNRNLI